MPRQFFGGNFVGYVERSAGDIWAKMKLERVHLGGGARGLMPRALPGYSVSDEMKSPPRMARAIRAAMVSFRVLLFIWTSEEFGEQGTGGGETA